MINIIHKEKGCHEKAIHGLQSRKKRVKWQERKLTQERGVLAIRGATQQVLEDERTSRVQEGDDGKGQSEPRRNKEIQISQSAIISGAHTLYIPVDPRIMLVSEDSKQAQGNHQSTNEVALFLLVFDITNSSDNKDTHTDDDKETAPETRTIFMDTSKGLEETNHRGKDNPAVPQREGGMDENLVPPRVGRIVLLQVICMHDKLLVHSGCIIMMIYSQKT